MICLNSPAPDSPLGGTSWRDTTQSTDRTTVHSKSLSICYSCRVTPVLKREFTHKYSSLPRVPSLWVGSQTREKSKTNPILTIHLNSRYTNGAKQRQPWTPDSPGGPTVGPDLEELTQAGHSRNSSQASRVSGYNSLPTHSRQGSSDSGNTRSSIEAIKFNSTERKRLNPSAKKIIEEQNRMDSTRVSADQLINELLEATNLEGEDDCPEGVGLELYVGKDGSTTLGSRQHTKLLEVKVNAGLKWRAKARSGQTW